MDKFSFWWHYEAPGCSNPANEPSHYSTSGATVVANNTVSDFALLLLTEDPKDNPNIKTYYLGWDRSGNAGTGGVGIHHPRGDTKKISTYSLQPGISNCFLSVYKLRRVVLKNSNYYPMEYATSSNSIIVEAVSGCFFSIKADFLRSIGFFDEGTFLYYEETILGYQIKNEGKQVIVDTTTPVYHCENIYKNTTANQRRITDKRLLQSAQYYNEKYLRVGMLGRQLYSVCFWVGKFETRLLNCLFKKGRR